jgi:hypothetical protein
MFCGRIFTHFYGGISVFPAETQQFFVANSVIFHALYLLKFTTFELYSESHTYPRTYILYCISINTRAHLSYVRRVSGINST